MSRPWWTKLASPTKEQWAYANAYHRAEEYAKKRGALRSPPKKGKREKKVRRKKVKRVKRKRPSKKAQRAFRAKLRGMVKRGKSVSLDTTLRRLVQAFPQADHTLKVWPKRSSLNSAVGRAPGSKRKLITFL